jgi:DNA polymerase-3 subunit gamma/tau
VTESTGNDQPVPPGPPAPAATPAPAAAAPAVAGALDIVAVRRLWPDLLDAVNQHNKTAAALLKNAEPAAVDAKRLSVAFSTPELARMFTQKGTVFLVEALRSMVGVDLQIDVSVGGAVSTTAGPADPPAAPQPQDEVDLSDSDDVAEDTPPHDPVALLQSNLGAEIIGEVDNS